MERKRESPKQTGTIVWDLSRQRADPDAALMQRMATGDEQALRQLYERQSGAILVYLTRQVGDRRLAEDLLQDVMLAAWEAAATYRGEGKVRAWLFTIAHNKACNARRRRDARPAPAGRDPDREPAAANTSLENTTERLDLQAAMARLPARQRGALDLVFFYGFTSTEAAAVMGATPGTVRSWLHRARQSLRRYLKGNDDV